MTYETFEKIIKTLEKIRNRTSTLYSLGLDILNYEEPYHEIITPLLQESFGTDGHDWISWYLYERNTPGGEVLSAWDGEGNPICYDIPSLWREVSML